jgi:hypothetical protein
VPPRAEAEAAAAKLAAANKNPNISFTVTEFEPISEVSQTRAFEAIAIWLSANAPGDITSPTHQSLRLYALVSPLVTDEIERGNAVVIATAYSDD